RSCRGTRWRPRSTRLRRPRPRPRTTRCTLRSAEPELSAMPRIDDIEDTPNPNAKKFILREPLTWGIARSYENAEQAQDDPLASALFAVGNVTNVFYVDRWITITQDGGADWRGVGRAPSPAPPRAPPARAQ